MGCFQDRHRVRSGDTLTRIAQANGHHNPGPVWAFPPNAALFRGRDPDKLRVGEAIQVQ